MRECAMISTIKQTVMVTLVCLHLILTGAVLLAQDGTTPEASENGSEQIEFTGEDRDVFAPFVSRLRVAVRDPQVRLTWRDADDLDGGHYRVYRHTEEITQETFPDATMVARVEAGTETFLDTPLEEGRYYYAIIAADSTDTVYPIFVPFRNKTIRSVAVAQLETEEDLAASVYNMDALVQDNAVVVRFETSRGGRDLVVYRRTTPFRSMEDIQDATLINEFESTTRRFADYPVPGVDYYYGVFDKALIERGTVSISAGGNTLEEPVRINLDTARDGVQIQFPRATKRRAPLPVLQLARDIRTGERLARNPVPPPAEGRMSGPTESAVSYLLSRAPEPRTFRPDPVILPEERTTEGEGAARTLAQVVQTDFSQGRYASAADMLRNLLTLPLSENMERRTRFYLGQALFFDGRREPAFMEFVLASEGELYSQTRPWIDGILLPRG
jgi:hypothetical protein